MTEGATANERIRAAIRDDNEDMLTDVFDGQDEYDINHQDGMGNTALHYAALYGSTSVLEHILCHDECDVDPVNNVGRETPLHFALQLKDRDVRRYVVRNLLEAGADTTIEDKNGVTAKNLISHDPEMEELLRAVELQDSFSPDDIAIGDEMEDGDYDESEEE